MYAEGFALTHDGLDFYLPHAWAVRPDSSVLDPMADGFEDYVRAVPAGEIADRFDALLPAGGDDVGDDLFGGQALGREHCQLAGSAVAGPGGS